MCFSQKLFKGAPLRNLFSLPPSGFAEVINKKFVVKEKTMQAIFAILAWSFQVLTSGSFPCRDHAGNPFLSSWRKKQKGKSLACTALLTEVRGDWEMYKNTFNLSGWSGTDNICYRCYASKDTSRDCTSSAVWRSQRKTTMDHFADCITEGKQISALFSAPGLQIDCFVIDWLHACDLGVAQDFLGNLIYFLLDRFPGASKDKRLSSVFRSMQSFYRRCSVDNRLDTLTMGMLRKTDKKTNKVSAPKLRASAGETRSLIPWSLEIAEALLDKSSTFENTIFQATLQLNTCYSLLSRDLWNPQDLATAGQRFLLLYVSLSDSDPQGMFWRFKPKHHLFQELCEFDECCPSQNWTYRDEDMGGTVAAISRRRGGEPCLPFGVCLFLFSPWLTLIGFDATDQSHLRKIQLLQLPGIHCTNSCLNTNFQSGLLHEEEKGILMKKVMAHICFLFISLPMDLSPCRYLLYILISTWKYNSLRMISTKRWGKQAFSEDIFCTEKQNLLRGDR